MIYPIAAIVLLWFLLSRANVPPRLPALSPGLYEKGASVAAVVVALVVLLRGNFWAALVLFGLGLWLLGRSTRRAEALAKTTISRVRSAMIEMEYQHADGMMSGRVIAGPLEGAALDRLDRTQCESVYAMCRRDDPDGARLLDAYLDRRFPGWRAAGHGDAHAGQAGTGQAGPDETRARQSSRMSEDEAYEVLGLRRGATRDEIVRAHRAVMKKWHPDQGGTAELAALANEAKEVLLRRHV